MKTDSSFELFFPCPACAQRISVRQSFAKGPCPLCHQTIEVAFQAKAISDMQELISTSSNTFERRRFRPVPKRRQVGPKASRKLSDQ